MVFNTITFTLFFVVFFHVYWWFNNNYSVGIRNGFILISSYVFYGWWDWRFLGLLIFSSVVDFFLGQLIDKTDNVKNKKILLGATIGINIGILGTFKYFNFFIETFHHITSVVGLNFTPTTLTIILPVGISFYTFQSLSYTIDIYRGQLKPAQKMVDFLAYVAFFPQLVVGPIERAKNLLPQFSNAKILHPSSVIDGMRWMLWGYFKKIVIADNLGLIVDHLFTVGNDSHSVTVLMGGILFGLQIYCDFSGYSDIAVGISKILGFSFMQNFNTPYFSSSFAEFWRRWHISLSTWFKDYVYIPLGGSKSGTMRLYLNLLITFLISGLWHGANYTFVIWGLLHGVVLILEKLILVKPVKFISIPLVFIIVCILWIPFRAQNIQHLIHLSQNLLAFNGGWGECSTIILHYFTIQRLGVLSAILLLFLVIEIFLQKKDISAWLGDMPKPMRWGIYYFITGCILLMSNMDVRPYFIYFQF